MKKFMICTAFLIIGLSAYCHDKSEKKFTFSILTGLAVPMEDVGDYSIFIEIGAQGEYRISEHFSVYIPLQYQQPISFDDLGDLGTLGILAGPRYYFGNNFFAGLGGGYAFYIDSGLGTEPSSISHI
jgi:hypothetical protein